MRRFVSNAADARDARTNKRGPPRTENEGGRAKVGGATEGNSQETRRGDLSQGNRFPAKDACRCTARGEARGKANVFRKARRSGGGRCATRWRRRQERPRAATGVKPVAKASSLFLPTSATSTKRPRPLQRPRAFRAFRSATTRSLHGRLSLLSLQLIRNKIIPSECKSTFSARGRNRPAGSLHFFARFFAVLQICCPRVFMTDDYTPRRQ